MKNYRVDMALTVTPVLYPLGGRESILGSITLNPSETRVLNINEALAASGDPAREGAVELRYSNENEGILGANMTVLNESKSLIYNFLLREPQTTRQLEGLWWLMDSDTDAFVAVLNTSATATTVTPTLYVKQRPYRLQAIQLASHEVKLINVRQELRNIGLKKLTEGGIQLESSVEGALIAGGGLMNPTTGFSAPIRMSDPRLDAHMAKRLGQTQHALNIPIGEPPVEMGLPAGSMLAPILNVRNVASEVIRVRPVFRYETRNATRSFALPEMKLKSQQTACIELLPYWLSGQIPRRVTGGSLEISHEGKAGSLVASVTSVDQSGTYVFDAKIDNRMGAGFEGEFWSLEGDNRTSVTVKNITQSPATCWISLQCDGGQQTYELQPQTLRPG